ncbi:MAG: Ig-like domain-containing protein, partial [Muribaculaceae bacterium]|nr:Ig-like domain-containing protein [Muribaculaceae bacterium]
SPGEQVTIAVALRTDATDISAAEIRGPLPEGGVPVDGSLTINGNRIPDHSLTADINGRDYVIVLFNTSLKAIPAGEGELLTFKVSLGENPGRFNLTPRVKLSDSRGSVIAAEATGSNLNIIAPRLELGSVNVNFGRVPIQSEVVRVFSVRNTGTATLDFSDYTTDIEGLTAVMPQQLEEGESARIELHYSPTVRISDIAGRFTPVTNSIGRTQFVNIRASLYSVNTLIVGNAAGNIDEEVTINIAVNNMEQIVGAELLFNLPNGLKYVDQSLELTSRSAGMLYECTVDSRNMLHIVLFSMNNQPIKGSDGDILNFRLLLNDIKGDYTITPSKVYLIAHDGTNVVSNVSSGKLHIDTSKISCARHFEIGDIIVKNNPEFVFNVGNIGVSPLVIDHIFFDKEGLRCITPMPLSIESGSSADLKFVTDNPSAGQLDISMRIYTNDPYNRVVNVNISAFTYLEDVLTIEGSYYHGNYAILGNLINDTPIVAMQADLVCPDNLSTDKNMIKLHDRALSHSVVLDKIADNRYRLVIFSLNNLPIADNLGKVFSISLYGEDITDKEVRLENIRLSNAEGEIITPPDATSCVTVLPEVVFVTGLSIKVDSPVIKIGETTTAHVEKLEPQNATCKDVDWLSSDSNIITIDKNGAIKAIGAGKANVIALAADGGGTFAQAEIEVLCIPVEKITLSQTDIPLKKGQAVSLTATVLPEDATDKTVTWSSSDEAIATVDAKGKVTAVAVGKAVIKASCGAVSATCEVTVLPVMVESITLTPDVWSGMAGDYIQLVAVVMPEDATDKSLSWTSSDEAVATVDDSGKVSIQSDGSCVITATANDGSGVEARCIITGLSGIEAIFSDGNTTADVYSLGGFLLKKNCDRAGLRHLAPGAYIVKQGQRVAKMIVR